MENHHFEWEIIIFLEKQLIAVMLSFKSDELLRFAVILIDSDSQNPPIQQVPSTEAIRPGNLT